MDQLDPFVHLAATSERGALRIECRWLNAALVDAPIAVFLHEGLGSVAMWKEWPQTLCDALGFRGLLYSRPGYGRSTPREPDVRFTVDYLQKQACDILPALLSALDVSNGERARMWLIGHSDGGSIALHYAAAFPKALAGSVVIAPHVMVEQMNVDAIELTGEAYRQGGLRTRLARYHDDVDSAFFGWHDIWLDPAFRSWDISASLASIECPLLAIQGVGDEYATMLQIETIQHHAPHTRIEKLEACGHIPHRDAPAALNAIIRDFVSSHREPIVAF